VLGAQSSRLLVPKFVSCLNKPGEDACVPSILIDGQYGMDIAGWFTRQKKEWGSRKFGVRYFGLGTLALGLWNGPWSTL